MEKIFICTVTALCSSSLAVQPIALLPVIKGVSLTDNQLTLDLVYASSLVTAESVPWLGATACASSVVSPPQSSAGARATRRAAGSRGSGAVSSGSRGLP